MQSGLRYILSEKEIFPEKNTFVNSNRLNFSFGEKFHFTFSAVLGFRAFHWMSATLPLVPIQGLGTKGSVALTQRFSLLSTMFSKAAYVMVIETCN